ncbi:MAG: flavodoxin domain-containing protein [Alphaproteobacteria bacterium]|nr:flavodoxin domain-containing protein [Alphaproteobacteria bacterium]
MANAAALAAPFPEDQLAAIQRLLAGATAEQRQWLAGYVAGWHAATEPRATPAAPPARKTPLTILYATESGNAETLAASARKEAARLGFAAKVVDMADTTPAELARAGNLLVIASTWGEGDPPQRAEEFFTALLADDAPRFADLRYAVLALGDRAYARFCETGRRIDERLAELGAARAAPRVECDLDYEAAASAWIGSTLRELAPDTGAAVIHVDFNRPAAAEESYSRARPFEAEITAMLDLNSSRSSTRNIHVELSLEESGIAYEPGDSLGFLPTNDPALANDVLQLAGLGGDAALRTALTERFDITTLTQPQIASYAALVGEPKLAGIAADAAATAAFIQDRQFIDLLAAAPHRLTAEQLTSLLRPLPPRLYSIASSRKQVGAEAHLLVGLVAWESHGRMRKGVASGDLAERRAQGQRMKVYLQPNRHFRLPADADRPIVMVGPGTGVAPFRAFMQETEATGANRRSWLFFGARNFLHDFLYQLEWQDWLKRGVLTRMDVAFSRDQPEKIYVQHRMWAARRELYRWLEDGAQFYVCGDAQAMAKDVHAALARIVADQSGRGDDHAQAYLRELQKSGRYLKDVY